MNLPAVLFRGVVPTTNGGETHDPLSYLRSAPLRRVLSNVPQGLRPVVRMNQLSLTPVHSGDPASSREAAARAAPKVRSQMDAVFAAVVLNRVHGMSNRELQIWVCDSNPGHPAWNKIPTRCRTLERMGFMAVAYCPSMVFEDVERLDVIRMAKLTAPYFREDIPLTESAAKVRDLVERSMDDRREGNTVAQAARATDLFQGLEEGDIYHL